MQLVKRECVSQTTERKTLPALNESIEKVKKNTNEAQRREETNSIIQHFLKKKKSREHGDRVENGVRRQGSERAGIFGSRGRG